MKHPPLRLAPGELRIFKDAYDDPGYPHLTSADLEMLRAFLAGFDQLGWIPPLGGKQRQLLWQFGVAEHENEPGVRFYEFCSQGARGEREPWLTLYFHISTTGRIRICAILLTATVARRPGTARILAAERVARLEQWLERHPTEA